MNVSKLIGASSRFGVVMGLTGAFAAAVTAGVVMGLGEAAPTTAAQAPSVPFSVDSVHSSALFRIKHLNVSYTYGRFNTIEGTFSIDKDKPEASAINLTIPVDSLDTNNASRDKHLKSPDFFSSKEFPTLTFASKSFKKAGDTSYEVTGDLTIHGKTKSVTATLENVGTGPGMQGGEVAGIETKFTIKRSDFGMSFMVGPAADEVTIMVALEGGRK